MEKISLSQQLAEAQRELDLRRRLYPGWIRSGKLAQATADRQLATQQAIVDTLRPLAGQERLL